MLVCLLACFLFLVCLSFVYYGGLWNASASLVSKLKRILRWDPEDVFALALAKRNATVSFGMHVQAEFPEGSRSKGLTKVPGAPEVPGAPPRLYVTMYVCMNVCMNV